MIRFTSILAFFLLALTSSNAQAKLFNSGDKVVVQISPKYGKVYVHEMQAQQTVYSLSKAFSQRMQDIKSVNPGINFDAMNVGQKIRVPFLAATMVKNASDVIKGESYANVYYKIRPKDNLYRIAKVYFDSSIENLMAINRSQSIDLKADDLIKVGWMPLGNTPKAKVPGYTQVLNTQAKPNPPKAEVAISSTTKVTTQAHSSAVTPAPDAKPTRTKAEKKPRKKKKKGFFSRIFGSKDKKKKREQKDIKKVVELSEQLEEKPSVQKATPQVIIQQEVPSPTPPVSTMEEDNSTLESVDEEPIGNIDLEKESEPLYVYKSDKGIAIWNQTSTNSKNMFALHPSAKVGSYIEITNPMLGKTVNAKVIGNIPPRTYTDDVSIVVSPRVAKMLGVVDKRFAVRVKYREE